MAIRFGVMEEGTRIHYMELKVGLVDRVRVGLEVVVNPLHGVESSMF